MLLKNIYTSRKFILSAIYCLILLQSKVGKRKTLYSTGASDRSFYPIFNKRFDHLESLLTIHRPKKVLPAGSLCGPLVTSPQSKGPKRTFILPQKYHASHSNMLSQSLKSFIENENEHKFQEPSLGRTPSKVLLQGFYFAP